MYINIIKNSPKPAYQQIMESVQKQILTGELKPEDELPSIRQLAQDIQVSVITIRRAYSDLENQGLIYSRPGVGSYVAQLEEDKLSEMKIELVVPLLAEVVRLTGELRLNSTAVEDLFKKMLEEGV
ncbi:MAG: GntR family transcriptional regulator [Bacillota bacterium]|nr:GntR family transcriptional regulator [Bacillota bacterium]